MEDAHLIPITPEIPRVLEALCPEPGTKQIFVSYYLLTMEVTVTQPATQALDRRQALQQPLAHN